MEYYKEFIEHLDKVTDEWSKALVGKVMKRFEILDNDPARKKAIKELIYENSRDLKTIIKSFLWGTKFNTPKK